MWSRSGRELFFESLDNRIMVAGYTVQGDSFIKDKPRLWSEKALAITVPVSRNVDLAPDGKRIVAVMPAEEGGCSSRGTRSSSWKTSSTNSGVVRR